MRDRAIVDAALRGVDAVIHQAAMVGMGTDIADLPEYVGCNDLGTAVLLAAMAQTRIGCLVLASSMVVYGEGAYTCAVDGPVRPMPRRAADLAAGQLEPRCPTCAAPLRPGLVTEDAALDPRSFYAATKLAREHQRTDRSEPPSPRAAPPLGGQTASQGTLSSTYRRKVFSDC